MSETDSETQEITFKTITQDVFKLPLSLATTVSEIKNKIFEERGEDYEVERQKLIYNGKVLDDTQILREINVDEKKYIVVMCSRVSCFHSHFVVFGTISEEGRATIRRSGFKQCSKH